MHKIINQINCFTCIYNFALTRNISCRLHIDFVFRNRLRTISINITLLDWLICARILFANIQKRYLNFTGFCAIVLSCSLFRYQTRFSVHFRHVKPVVGLQERGVVNRGIRSSVGGSDRGTLSAFTPAEISPGWFIHINVSHCTSPYANCTRGNKTAEKSRPRFMSVDHGICSLLHCRLRYLLYCCLLELNDARISPIKIQRNR